MSFFISFIFALVLIGMIKTQKNIGMEGLAVLAGIFYPGILGFITLIISGLISNKWRRITFMIILLLIILSAGLLISFIVNNGIDKVINN